MGCMVVIVVLCVSLRILILFHSDDPEADPKIKGDPSCTLMVARLNLQTDEETLERVFSKWGKIKRLRLIRDIGILLYMQQCLFFNTYHL